MRQYANPLLLSGVNILEMFPFMQRLLSSVPRAGLHNMRTIEKGRFWRREVGVTLDKLDDMSTAAIVSAYFMALARHHDHPPAFASYFSDTTWFWRWRQIRSYNGRVSTLRLPTILMTRTHGQHRKFHASGR